MKATSKSSSAVYGGMYDAGKKCGDALPTAKSATANVKESRLNSGGRSGMSSKYKNRQKT